MRPSRSPGEYTDRDEYRRLVRSELSQWHLRHKETELLICADEIFQAQAKEAAVALRQALDAYIIDNPAFGKSFDPIEAADNAPEAVVRMCEAAAKAGVGPMAAVAGAFAHHVGLAVLAHSKQVIVENGGDVYMKLNDIATVAVYAGQSPLSMKVGVEIDSTKAPVAICTSAGSVGHSVSFGKADAAVVLSCDAYLADACATRLGNEIKTAADIEDALNMIADIDGVIGAVAVIGEACGAVGDIQLRNV